MAKSSMRATFEEVEFDIPIPTPLVVTLFDRPTETAFRPTEFDIPNPTAL